MAKMLFFKSPQDSVDLLFEEKWPSMRAIVLKLLQQEPVTHKEWQDLFYNVHKVYLWDDDKGATKIREALTEDIVDFIKKAQQRVLTHQEDQALLKAYIAEWRKFFAQCNYLPTPFRRIECKLGNHDGKRAQSEESVVRTLMLDSWNKSVFNDIKNRLQDAAMKLVHAERTGEAFDSQLVIGVRESYVNLCSNSEDKLQIYRENFEKPYVEATEAFYKVKAPEYLEANGVQSYMKYADTKLREEEQRARKYLESCNAPLGPPVSQGPPAAGVSGKQECDGSRADEGIHKLTECCVNVLVTAFKNTILAECTQMIKNNETEKLQLMVRLMDRVPDGIAPMLQDLVDHIVSAGLADMQASADLITQDSEKYVEQLLALFNQFSRLVKEAFNDDPRFLTARDKAFKQVVNDTTVFKLELPCKQGMSEASTKVPIKVVQAPRASQNTGVKSQPESKCPELLANYCDMLLRRTPLSKKLTTDEIERKLRDVVRGDWLEGIFLPSFEAKIYFNFYELMQLLVLKYVQNKDVFMRYHKAHLTRRLILDISADSEKEENMVEWLREVGMPADYVNKLARMFQDVKVSEDLNQQFKKQCRSTRGTIADSINIKILNAGAWARGSERVTVSLPMELEDYIPEVEDFYKKKHSGRKLQWYHHMSNGTITFATKSGGRYDMDVTTFQMAVLFAWNQRPMDRVSYENLRLATELPDPELRRTLWSLVAFPKLKRQVLMYAPEVQSPKDFDENTQFWVNQDFALIKNGKPQKRGKMNLVGRLQLSTERSKEEDNESIVQLRILRVQEAIIKILKTRKKMSNSQLQTELVDILKNMFLPSKKMIKEQIEWLIEHRYMKRDEDDINTFIYVA